LKAGDGLFVGGGCDLAWRSLFLGDWGGDEGLYCPDEKLCCPDEGMNEVDANCFSFVVYSWRVRWPVKKMLVGYDAML
jgi:hypothetical protein